VQQSSTVLYKISALIGFCSERLEPFYANRSFTTWFLVFRCDACEEASKAAKLRAEKAEEEVLELMNKARQLEIELGNSYSC
jgi:hypothetical protein